MAKETKRQRQMSEIVKRHFSEYLQLNGSNIYGSEALVTVTNVKISPDFNLAKVYLSIYNTENKQEVILMMEDQQYEIQQGFYQRVRKHVRRVPELNFYMDDTLDEMYRLRSLFNKLEDDNQMGRNEE